MNRQLTKGIFIACAVFTAALMPTFAHGMHGHGCCCGERGSFPRFAPRAAPARGAALMGTVRSVDAVSSVIDVTDADGSSRSVHINPLTRITTRLSPGSDFRGPERLDILSIKEGDFVIVTDFNTRTDTLEASGIEILQEG